MTLLLDQTLCIDFSEHPWSLWIWTSDLAGAGSDADISFQVYGEKGKSDEIRLENKTDNFEQGQVDRFMVCSLPYNLVLRTLLSVINGWQLFRSMIQMRGVWGNWFSLDVDLQVELPDLGKLTKFRIWHEKRNPFAGWHLSKVNKIIISHITWEKIHGSLLSDYYTIVVFWLYINRINPIYENV